MTAALLAALLYPLDHPPQVTSTFGAYRLTHHHAGLDLGTSGDETIRVIAADAGRIYRIRRAQNGYGRAVYIRHADGRLTVYGHFSALVPKLAALIHEAELRTGDYRVDRRVDIPVARGEHLGWVGTAGTDLVHLHFELRDGDPVNPLTNGLSLPDTQPPRFVTLLARPRRADAHVAHGFADAFLDFAPDGTLPAPIVAGGDFVLLVDVRDRIDGSERDLRPYELELHLDGKRVHHTRYDRVSYRDKFHIELDADPALRAAPNGRVFHRLYSEHERIRVHKKALAHLRRLRRGDHSARLVARDAAGNESQATFTLRITPREPPCKVSRRRVKDPPPVVPTRIWRAGVLAVALPGLCDDPRLEVRGGRPAITRLGATPAVALPVTDGRIHVAWPGGRLNFRAHRLADEHTFNAGPIGVEIGSDARFAPLPTEVTTEPATPPDGLEVLTPIYRFANAWEPAHGAASVGIRTRERDVALYLEDHGRWWRLGAARRAGRLWGSAIHLTGFALARDTAAPILGHPFLEAHPAGTRIVVPVTERNVANFALELDGKAVLPEWQRAWGRLVYRPWTPLAPGPHHLHVQVTDRAGWTSEAEFTLPEAIAPPAARSTSK